MRLAGRILKWLSLGVLGLLVAGALYQQIGLAVDARFAPPRGDMVRIDGRAAHLACSGQGPRTFVLDAGAGAGVWEWYRLGPRLAKAGRVCAFDRAGLGWSDPAGAGNDGTAAAAQLSALVRVGKIPTPFIYVGHSLGANFGEIYRARYPRDVAALVLIEPGVPKDLLEDFHAARRQAMESSDCGATCYAAGAATTLGVVRLASLGIGHKTFDDWHRSLYQAYLSRPSNMMTMIASLNALPKTAYEDLDVRSFDATPVLVFASSGTRQPEGHETRDDLRKWQMAQRAYLASLAAKSSRGAGLFIVPDSTHASMVLGEPQANIVARRIIEFTTHAGL